MGGVTKYPVPRFVWSHAGGWWRDNHETWRRSLVVAAGTIAGVLGLIANKSVQLEEWNPNGAFSQSTMVRAAALMIMQLRKHETLTPSPQSMGWNRNPKSPHRVRD